MPGRTSWKDIRAKSAERNPDFEAGVARERAKLELAGALRVLRDKAGLSQTELAELLGVTQANVSRIENEGDPHLSTIVGYAGALGADLMLKAILPDGSSEVVLVELKASGEHDSPGGVKRRGFAAAKSSHALKGAVGDRHVVKDAGSGRLSRKKG